MTSINSAKKYKEFINNQLSELRAKNNVSSDVCKYFSEIGSVPLEDIHYEDQLVIKLNALKLIFNNIVDQKLLLDYKLEASPVKKYYRFKMEFACSYNPFTNPQNRFGQRARKRFNHVVDMHSSTLIKPDDFERMRLVFDYIMSLNIMCFDLIKHIGKLRYLTFKGYDNQRMLNITFFELPEKEVEESIGEFALKRGFNSVNIILNSSKTDTSEGEIKAVYGEKYIKVKVLDKQFKLGPESFFQNNIAGFELILREISSFLKQINTKDYRLLDLYSGTGLLGISFAEKFKEILGFDIKDENIFYAKENCELNLLKNLKYETSDISKLDPVSLGKQPSITIVDPPRVGLLKEGILNVLKFEPNYIIYISCNPITQALDLVDFLKNGFKVKIIKGYDLFPNTYHLENLIILEKI